MRRQSSIKGYGKVYLTGAGPGDPDLITVKGLKTLQKADVVVYDRLAVPDLLNEVSAKAELIYVGKKPGRASASQEQINEVLLQKAVEGKTVVRLKGGDPFIFGRGGEEARHLASHGVDFEVIPGISSALSAPMFAGIPLTYRNLSRSFTVITGHVRKSDELKHDWDRLAGEDTLVVLMGMSNLNHIAHQLMLHGKAPETPVGIIHKATYADQETVIDTLVGVSEKSIHITSPSVIVIGEVVLLANEIAWFGKSENKRGQKYQPSMKIAAAGI
ncbi:MAG: uroporphyrinogen-III C-methyltransferase [Balneolales bacterium]